MKKQKILKEIKSNMKKVKIDRNKEYSPQEIEEFEAELMKNYYSTETKILDEYITLMKNKKINKFEDSVEKILKEDRDEKIKAKNLLESMLSDEDREKLYNEYVKQHYLEILDKNNTVICKRSFEVSYNEKIKFEKILDNVNNDSSHPIIFYVDSIETLIEKFNKWINEWDIDLDYFSSLTRSGLMNLDSSFESMKRMEKHKNKKADFIVVNKDGRLISGYKDKKFLKYEKNRKKREFVKSKKEYEKIKSFNENFEYLIKDLYGIDYKKLKQLKKDYSTIYDNLDENRMKNNLEDISEMDKFKKYYISLDKIKDLENVMKALQNNSNEINRFFSLYNSKQNIYLTFKEREKLINLFKSTYDNIKVIEYLPIHFKSNVKIKNLMEFINLFKDILTYKGLSDTIDDNLIKQHNARYIDKKISENKEFFNDIDDISKLRAIINEEDNLRINAGAGTGKTFTIKKKIRYLIEKKNVSPEKILCLCYTRKGAEDLDEKVNQHTKEENKVGVYTFHEFSRRVAKACGKIKSTNRYLLDDIIRNYMKNSLEDDDKISKILEYFAYYFEAAIEEKFKDEEEFEEYNNSKNLITLKDKFEVIARDKKNLYEFNNKESIHGEIVKSFEELMIANYLFMHNIEYEYETNYPYNYFSELIKKQFLYSGKFLSLHKIPNEKDLSNEYLVKKFISWEEDRERYQPDFYLKDYDLYLEHFGVDEDMKCRWLEEEAAREYEKGMKSKILWHEMYGTKLIETYSYYRRNGVLLEELEKLLKENNVEIGQRDKKEVLEIILKIRKTHYFNSFSKLIKTFINLFESKDMKITDFKKFKEESQLLIDNYSKKREGLFFDITEDIYKEYYEATQGDVIDHNREITNALNLIESGEFNRKYDYIMIDEYQDINPIRTKLIQALKEKTGAKLFVVGDDWQSIYKFNGSEINLFTDFEKYFPNSETISIQMNRRNPQELINISSSFIKQNPKQLKKKLKYYKDETGYSSPIKIVRYQSGRYEKAQKIYNLEGIILDMIKYKENKLPKIVILGRKNRDIDPYVNNSFFKKVEYKKFSKIIYYKKRELDIIYMTIHQSKGLEFDEVIVINLEDRVYGFPSKINDDSILRYVKSSDEYPYAEERRLFYVALTRTKNNVYLLTPNDMDLESEFVTELSRDHYVRTHHIVLPSKYHRTYDSTSEEKIPHETGIKCPDCERGNIVLIEKKIKGTTYFECDNPLCDSNFGPYYGNIEDIKYVEKCPNCRGMLIKRRDQLVCCLNRFGCTETRELKLEKDELEDEIEGDEFY